MRKKILLHSGQKPAESSVLDDIQKKITNSPALNGGFDTLLFKIDKIEQSQGQLVSKVDKIHDAIYDPQDGIFSKLSEYKLKNASELNKVTQEIVEIQVWKDHRTKEEFQEEQNFINSKKKIDELEKSVDVLVRNRNNILAVMKWFLFATGGAVVTLLMKWIETKLS